MKVFTENDVKNKENISGFEISELLVVFGLKFGHWFVMWNVDA